MFGEMCVYNTLLRARKLLFSWADALPLYVQHTRIERLEAAQARAGPQQPASRQPLVVVVVVVTGSWKGLALKRCKLLVTVVSWRVSYCHMHCLRVF